MSTADDDLGLVTLIAEEITAARKRAGLSQRELAQRAGVDQAMISRIESGARLPRLETLVSLADAMDHVLEIRLRRPRRPSASGVRRSR